MELKTYKIIKSWYKSETEELIMLPTCLQLLKDTCCISTLSKNNTNYIGILYKKDINKSYEKYLKSNQFKWDYIDFDTYYLIIIEDTRFIDEKYPNIIKELIFPETNILMFNKNDLTFNGCIQLLNYVAGGGIECIRYSMTRYNFYNGKITREIIDIDNYSVWDTFKAINSKHFKDYCKGVEDFIFKGKSNIDFEYAKKLNESVSFKDLHTVMNEIKDIINGKTIKYL